MALTRPTTMSEEEFREFSLGDPQGRWELIDGQLRERTGMSSAHGDVLDLLLRQLYAQLDSRQYRVRPQHARLRVSPTRYYIPDVAVIPIAVRNTLMEHPRGLEAFPDPLPLVVEIWSPSTGDFDMVEKLPGYQRRGDAEIWFIHPYTRTLSAWRRRPNGAYAEKLHRGGIVRPDHLPGVAIDLDALFET